MEQAIGRTSGNHSLIIITMPVHSIPQRWLVHQQPAIHMCHESDNETGAFLCLERTKERGMGTSKVSDLATKLEGLMWKQHQPK